MPEYGYRFFYFSKNMEEKACIRRWVLETLEGILKGEIEKSTFGNIRLNYVVYFDNIVTDEIFVQVYSKSDHRWMWMDRDYFKFQDYFKNYYEMITRTWIGDMVNDITEVILTQDDADTNKTVIE